FQAAMIYLKKGETTQAAPYFKKAAAAGLAEAQHNYGIACLKGDGVAQSVEEAVQWLAKAARQGNLNSAMRLGRMYLTGNGLSADVATALSWYQQANSP